MLCVLQHQKKIERNLRIYDYDLSQNYVRQDKRFVERMCLCVREFFRNI